YRPPLIDLEDRTEPTGDAVLQAHARPVGEAPDHPPQRLDVPAEPHEFIAGAGGSQDHGVVAARSRLGIGFAQADAELVDGDDRLGRVASAWVRAWHSDGSSRLTWGDDIEKSSPSGAPHAGHSTPPDPGPS